MVDNPQPRHPHAAQADGGRRRWVGRVEGVFGLGPGGCICVSLGQGSWELMQTQADCTCMPLPLPATHTHTTLPLPWPPCLLQRRPATCLRC